MMSQKSKSTGIGPNHAFALRRGRMVLSLFLLLTVVVAPLGAAPKHKNNAQEETNEIHIGPSTETPAQTPAKTTSKHSSTNGLWNATLQGTEEIFSSDLALSISLGDVLLLVVLVNILALFNKPRLIMAVSYLFCLKWVFWSNYKELLGHSDAVATSSSFIFVLCGILTTVLFVLDRFNARNT